MSTEQLESVPSRSDPAYIDGKTTGTIADFLADNRPSNANPEHAWIWVRGRKGEDDDERIPTSDYGKMVENAMAVAAKLAEDCEAIKKDDSIPVRASKKNPRSKKVAREELHGKAHADLKDLAQKHHDLTGKWLFFESEERCDEVFDKLAHALIDNDGALRSTAAMTLKISTSCDGGTGPEDRRVLCLYCRDSWNREEVKKVFEVVTEMGLFTQSYKADIVTLAGIDSKHPSGIKSTLYNPSDFFTKEEVQAKVQKKTLEEENEDNPFGSDSEEEPPKKKAKN